MSDPKPLTRKELAEFLPNQRAIRAFEKLFDLVPTDLEEILLIAETAILNSSALRTENENLKQKLFEVEVQLLKRDNSTQVLQKLESLEQRIESLKPAPNLDPLIKRVEILETLEG